MNRMTRIVTSSSIESKVPRFGITIVCTLEFYIPFFFFVILTETIILYN